MTLVREYQPTFVLGDGETKEFSYLFEEVSENFIKVIVKHSDDSTYTPVFSVDLDSHKVVFGESETAPLDTDVVCIYRETPDLQDTPFRTLQGYDAKALENILSKIVAMIQELKANGFSTQILQGTPWQLDLLHPADDGASVVVDYNARILKKGLYFQIVSGNLQVSADGNSFITMPKSADITEFRRLETVLEDLTVQYRLQYKVDGVWYNAESNAEATADEAKQIAEEARDIASDAKDIAQDAKDIVDTVDGRVTQAEQDASDAKDIANTTAGNLTTHIGDTNNPHSVTKAQIGLGNCDNTADLDKPISTATQTALDTKATPADITSAISTHNADSSAHSNIISPIQEVIPAAATSSNQLADKNFVNSSIATSTATFRGTYNSLAELEAQTADENDYGFVVSTDAAGNTIYNRYKYTTSTTPASWVFEYALNNSSFTATQWAAINSGANTTNIGQIATNTTTISNHIGDTSNPHQVTKAQVGLSNVDNTSDLDKPISTATQTALNGKQATISDLATIRSNAQAGKAASDTIATYGDIVTHDVAEFATAAQGAKADTALQAGDNVSELVNDAGYLVMGDLTNFVTKNTAQTISGLKTFSADITLSGTTSIKNTTSGVSYTMLYRDASGIHIGTSTQALLLAGSNARPKFNNNDVAMLSDIPTAVSQLTNDSGFITNAVNNLQNYTLTSALATVATSGSYNDLSDKPTIPTVNNATLTIQKNGTTVQTFTANQSTNATANITVPVTAADVNALPDTTKYVANASMTINSTTYVVTLQLKDQDGNNIGTAQTIDLPLESVVVSGSYDSVNKKIVLTLQDGSTIDVPVADLVAGLQTEITSTNKLDADLVDDSTSTNKFVTASDKSTWNGKQDAISDLTTIRSNASSGASAYTTIQGYGNIVTHNASEFATSAQGALADTAVQPGDLASVATSGSYNDLLNKPTIPTVNNPTITITQGGITKGSFSLNQASGDTIALDAGGGGIGNIDNITITANADDEIQAVGTVNQNTAVGATNPIKSWLGDINEYNNQSVPTSNPDALCFIVDKTQTATDRYIVEAQYPDDTNGHTWYFLYSDGWVEQGGVITGNYTGTITLPVEMANTNYYISTTVITTRSGASYDRELYPNSVDTTGFTTQNFSGGQNVPGRWMVQGLSA